MIIFTRTYDLLTWLLPHCDHFPATQRFMVTKRLCDCALEFNEMLFLANANRKDKRADYLRQADGYLNLLRMYLRMIYGWRWLSVGQYEHVSKMIEEIGRLLGGWMKQSGL